MNKTRVFNNKYNKQFCRQWKFDILGTNSKWTSSKGLLVDLRCCCVGASTKFVSEVLLYLTKKHNKERIWVLKKSLDRKKPKFFFNYVPS